MRKKADQLSLLKENINALKESLKWLKRSYEICKAYKKLYDLPEEARLIKELRNDIVHEYVLKDIIPLFDEVTKKTPVLLQYSGNAIEYEKELEQKIGGK